MLRRIAALLGDAVNREHEQHRHQHARDDAGQEQAADGNLAGYAEEDQAQGRRNGRGDQAAHCQNAGGEALGIAALFHIRAENAALHRGVSRRGAGNAAHHAGEQHGDLRKTAAHMAGRLRAELDEAGGDARFVHQVAGQDKERNGQQREGLRGADHLLHQNLERNLLSDHVGKRGGAHRQCDRHAQRKQNDKRNSQENHAAISFL